MTNKHLASWRLRLIIIAFGLALGFFAKWISGHYNAPRDGDKPARQVALHGLVIPRQTPPPRSPHSAPPAVAHEYRT